MSNQFPTLHIVDHPLVQHKLSVMRDKNTSVKDFRALVGEIAMLLTYEATRDLPMTTRTIETPICSYEAPVLAGKKLAIVPILRAGLGMVNGVCNRHPVTSTMLREPRSRSPSALPPSPDTPKANSILLRYPHSEGEGRIGSMGGHATLPTRSSASCTMRSFHASWRP